MTDNKEKNEAELIKAELVDLLYIISHDFNAPLRHIDGFARLVKERNSKLLDERSNLHLDQITGATERLAGMFNGILSLSRIYTRQKEFESLDLNILVKELVDEKKITEESNSNISVSVDNLPILHCDKRQVEAAIEALIDNAFLYRNGDTVSIIIEQVETETQIGFSIHDGGIGIDEKFHEEIFKPLRRGVNPDEYEGYGIGLCIVSKVAERHKGSVRLESKNGEGSTFYLYFPKELQLPD